MTDFETIEVDSHELEVSFHKSDYAQVVFTNIAETYTTPGEIECGYMLTPSLSPSNRDWVGLYKVGWRSSREYHCFSWVVLPQSYTPGSEAFNSVTFKANDLPGDDGEFYQFCYVAASGQVRGASTPFQFKTEVEEEYVEVEAEDGELLVVKTRTAVLEEKLSVAVEERALLEKECTRLDAECGSLQGKLQELEKQLEEEAEKYEEKVKEGQDIITCLRTEARDMQLVHDGLHEKISVLNQEKQSMEKRLDDNDVYVRDLQEKIKVLINDKDAMTGRNKTLEEEKELFKNHFTSSESTVQCYLHESQRLKAQLDSTETECKTLREEVEAMREKYEVEKRRVEETVRARVEDKEVMVQLEERLRNAEDRLSAAERCKVLLNEEVTSLQLVCDKVSTDLEASRSAEFSVRQTLTQLEEQTSQQTEQLKSDCARLQNALHDMQSECDEQRSVVRQLREDAVRADEVRRCEESGPLYALQTAQDNLKQRLVKVKRNNEELRQQLKDAVQREVEAGERARSAQREAEDLKERLLMGQEEYKTQYVQRRRLEAQLKRVKLGADRQLSTNEVQTEAEPAPPTESAETGEKEIQTDQRTDSERCAHRQQIDQLTKQLEKQRKKTAKYKQLLKDEEATKLMQRELHDKVVKVRSIETEHLNHRLASYKRRCEELTQKLSKGKQQTSPEKKDTKAKKIPTDTASGPKKPSSLYANPYQKYKAVTPLTTPPASPTTPTTLPEDVKDFDPLSDSSTESLPQPLSPLPPPISPVQTPEAKVAALKAMQSATVASAMPAQTPPISGSSPVVIPTMTPVDVRPVPTAPTEPHTEEPEDETEFVDAEEAPPLTCPVCQLVFPAGTTQTVVSSHVEDHYSRVCPVCNENFSQEANPRVFQTHVERHFDE